jgi:hypothetical protein
MTTTFRLESVRIDTTAGAVTYDFPGDLTVLAGDTGVGKTSLLELIKFGLGGDGLIAPVVANHVAEVHLTVRVGRSRFQLTRPISERGRRQVRVVDLITGEQLPDHPVGSTATRTDDEQTISDLLMTALGLPTDLRAAAAGTSNRPGARITFSDVFRYMYVPQSAINQAVAGSGESYYQPKRRAVFELLFGLTRPEILDLRSRLNELNSQVATAERDHETVQRFLTDSNTESRFDAEAAQAAVVAEERAAAAELERLRSELGEAVDRETQTLRDLLTTGERALAEARERVVDLNREGREHARERRRVEQDLVRLDRMASAGERLANIEFVVCPRCTQSLTERDVPAGACRVCLQDDIVADLPDGGYERGQLADQLVELDRQIVVVDAQASEAAAAVRSRNDLIVSLTRQIDERTAGRVTPRLQAYADAISTVERARAAQQSIERVLRQWDRAEDLQRAAAELGAERSRLEADIATQTAELDDRRREILEELNAEFQATVAAFGIPGGQAASIHPTNYLPMLGGRNFSEVSSAGGIATATQVAYWLTLVTVATRRQDTLYPAFLLIDSPRLALSTAEDIASQMYRRFVTQVSVVPGRVQFIVADNQLPAAYGREFTEFTFSYAQPTIGTVEHPGPARVERLTASTGDGQQEGADSDVD